MPMGDPIPTGDVGESSNFVLTDDGKRLLVNDPHNHAVEWNLDVDTWPHIACHTAGRNLTADEFATYFGEDSPTGSPVPSGRPPDSDGSGGRSHRRFRRTLSLAFDPVATATMS